MSKNLSIQTLALNFIQNKSDQNFSILIKRLRPGLLKFAYNYVKDKDLANEVISQVDIAIWEKIDQYNEKWNFSTWTYGIAKNEALGILRNKSKNVSYDTFSENHSKVFQIYNPVVTMEIESIGPTGEELAKILFDASVSAINTLEEPYKIVITEKDINRKQLNDIAEELGWNLSTVKTRLRKARKDVAEVLYKKYPDLVDSYFGNESEE
jgi:RNA polymerase sigma-70 factor (ECF subfamily)